MTLETQQNVLGITDAQIAVVTANTKDSYTIGERIEIPDLSSLDVTVTSETKEAKAGFKLADSFTMKTGYDVKFESVNIPMDVIAQINGATMTSDGTTPAQKNVVVDNEADVPVMFNLAFKSDLINGQATDIHMELYCVKGLLDVVTKADDYWTCSFEGKAFARKIDGAFRAITTNETAADIDDTVDVGE